MGLNTGFANGHYNAALSASVGLATILNWCVMIWNTVLMMPPTIFFRSRRPRRNEKKGGKYLHGYGDDDVRVSHVLVEERGGEN